MDAINRRIKSIFLDPSVVSGQDEFRGLWFVIHRLCDDPRCFGDGGDTNYGHGVLILGLSLCSPLAVLRCM